MALAFAFIFTIIFALFPSNSLASVLAIDYGTDWAKASLIKPGLPFDVVLNKDSKRKIQSSVGWKRDDRLFASEAFNIATRYPADSFSFLKYLQGQLYSSPAVSEYSRLSPSTKLIPYNERDTIAIQRPDGKEWSVEELIAMQFSYIKELAEGVAGEKVLDVVVAVPAFFSQFERQAVLDAIEIAGLRSLSLINDGTAVALNYAMTRSFPTRETHIIYDAGSSSLRASLISFLTSPANNSTSIEVKSFAYDKSAGGNELSSRIQSILSSQFEKTKKVRVGEDGKAMAKLWKEAERVKAVLSANAEATVTIESLSQDIDFRSRLSRSEFEDACADLKPRFAQPIWDVLSQSGLTLDNITSVILTGGHSRVPMVRDAIRAAVGEDKIAQNVNADEAAALGAAFYGASLSRQFRTKEIKVQDITSFDVQVSYLTEPKSSSKETDPKQQQQPLQPPRTIHTLIFGTGSKVGGKKTLSLKRKEDFEVRVGYKTSSPQDLLDVRISGIPEALANLTALGAQETIVKLTVALSESGIVSIQDAVMWGDVKDDTITGKLKNLFGASSTAPTDGQTDVDASSTGTETESAVKGKETGGVSSGAEVRNSIPLVVDVTPLGVVPLSDEQKRKSRKRLKDLDLEEQYARKKEETRNALEAYLYRLRDALYDGADTDPLYEYSTKEEREALKSLLGETFTWMGESAEKGETKEFRERKSALEKLEAPILKRQSEEKAVPIAINQLKQAIAAGRHFITAYRLTTSNTTTNSKAADTPQRFTPEEIEGLEDALNESERWVEEEEKVDEGRPKWEDRMLGSEDVVRRAKELQSVVDGMVKRKVPKRPKTTTTTSSSSSKVATESAAAGEETLTKTSPETDIPSPGAEETAIPVRHEEL